MNSTILQSNCTEQFRHPSSVPISLQQMGRFWHTGQRKIRSRTCTSSSASHCHRIEVPCRQRDTSFGSLQVGLLAECFLSEFQPIFCPNFSAGVGRTGTFIAVDQLWQMLIANSSSTSSNNGSNSKSNSVSSTLSEWGRKSSKQLLNLFQNLNNNLSSKSTIDIFGLVYRLRNWRPSLVQTEVRVAFRIHFFQILTFLLSFPRTNTPSYTTVCGICSNIGTSCFKRTRDSSSHNCKQNLWCSTSTPRVLVVTAVAVTRTKSLSCLDLIINTKATTAKTTNDQQNSNNGSINLYITKEFLLVLTVIVRPHALKVLTVTRNYIY